MKAKKIILEGDGYADGCEVYDIAKCPHCDYVLDDDYNPFEEHEPYCPHCGQKLDWDVAPVKQEEEMVKMMLVVDVPIDIARMGCFIDGAICYKNGDYSAVFKDCVVKLKQMPRKRRTLVNWYNFMHDTIPVEEPSEYDDGWNDCVDFCEAQDGQ